MKQGVGFLHTKLFRTLIKMYDGSKCDEMIDYIKEDNPELISEYPFVIDLLSIAVELDIQLENPYHGSADEHVVHLFVDELENNQFSEYKIYRLGDFSFIDKAIEDSLYKVYQTEAYKNTKYQKELLDMFGFYMVECSS